MWISRWQAASNWSLAKLKFSIFVLGRPPQAARFGYVDKIMQFLSHDSIYA